MPSLKLQPSRRGVNVDRLNPQQQVFVLCLQKSKSFNPTEAAREAGYKNPSQAANKLMKNKIVLRAVGKEIYDRKTELKIEATDVLRELMVIGFANPKEMFDRRGNLLSIHEMPDSIAKALSGFDVEVNTNRDGSQVTTIKPRFWSKTSALEMIAKHLGMLNEKLSMEYGVSKETVDMLGQLLMEAEQRSNVIDVQALPTAAING